MFPLDGHYIATGLCPGPGVTLTARVQSQKCCYFRNISSRIFMLGDMEDCGILVALITHSIISMATETKDLNPKEWLTGTYL